MIEGLDALANYGPVYLDYNTIMDVRKQTMEYIYRLVWYCRSETNNFLNVDADYAKDEADGSTVSEILGKWISYPGGGSATNDVPPDFETMCMFEPVHALSLFMIANHMRMLSQYTMSKTAEVMCTTAAAYMRAMVHESPETFDPIEKRTSPEYAFSVFRPDALVTSVISLVATIVNIELLPLPASREKQSPLAIPVNHHMRRAARSGSFDIDTPISDASLSFLDSPRDVGRNSRPNSIPKSAAADTPTTPSVRFTNDGAPMKTQPTITLRLYHPNTRETSTTVPMGRHRVRRESSPVASFSHLLGNAAISSTVPVLSSAPNTQTLHPRRLVRQASIIQRMPSEDDE